MKPRKERKYISFNNYFIITHFSLKGKFIKESEGSVMPIYKINKKTNFT